MPTRACRRAADSTLGAAPAVHQETVRVKTANGRRKADGKAPVKADGKPKAGAKASRAASVKADSPASAAASVKADGRRSGASTAPPADSQAEPEVQDDDDAADDDASAAEL